MSRVLDELCALLALEKIEENRFRGQSQDLGWGTVFGGQVLGQALSAAQQTVSSERPANSIHAYFLRPGDVKRPILYEVDRTRDGASFSTRRVVAIQGGQPIFDLVASFQVAESGFEHQEPMPEAPEPLTVPTEQERFRPRLDTLPAPLRPRALADRPFEIRPVEPIDDPVHPAKRPATRRLWMRAAAPLPDDPALHAALFAYASDHAFLTTSLLPHGVTWLTPGMQVASLDHALWLHAPFRVDEWFLTDMESPAARGARGLVRGRVYTQEGRLVASSAQEGLIRQREAPRG